MNCGYNLQLIIAATLFFHTDSYEKDFQQKLTRRIFYNGERRLIDYLLNNYDTRTRPVMFANETVNITFGNSLSQLIDVDEKNQIITTNTWLNINWIDVNLLWNPSEFDNITVIHLPYKSIWLPDIILYNNAESAYQLATLSTNVIVQSDGNVTWLSTNIFESACLINVKWFPFDEQFCDMVFASWTYSNKQLDIGLVTEEMDNSNYMRNTEWELIYVTGRRNDKNYSCCPDVSFPDVTFTIHIRRKPLFYVFNMLLPCIIITYVALLGFLVPPESGEKVTMGITTLLSMTVFLMLVCEQLPPNSQSLPMIGIYYGVSISIVSLATGFTVLTLNIHNMGKTGKLVPHWLHTLCFKYVAQMLCLSIELPPLQVHRRKDSEDSLSSSSQPLSKTPSLRREDNDTPSISTHYYERLQNLWSQFRRHATFSTSILSRNEGIDTENNSYELSDIDAKHGRCCSKNNDALSNLSGNKLEVLRQCINVEKAKNPFSATYTTTYMFSQNNHMGDEVTDRSENEVSNISSGFYNCALQATPCLAPRLRQNSQDEEPQQQEHRFFNKYSVSSSTNDSSIHSAYVETKQKANAQCQTEPCVINHKCVLDNAHQDSIYFQKVLHEIEETIRQSEIRWVEQQTRQFVCREWHEVAKVLDRLFLVIFVSLTTIVTAGLIFQAPSASYSMKRGDY